MLVGKALFRPKRVVPRSPLAELVRSQAEGVGTKDANFDAGLAIGSQIGQQLRKATPVVVLAAGVLGLVIGLRPQVLGLFSRKEPRNKG
jgi:hypothetical protein